MENKMESLQYPIGRFVWPEKVSSDDIKLAIERTKIIPNHFRDAIHDLAPEQLDTPYRPEGWTARQVVHHCADSHMNAYMRFKLALTEETPVIKPYAQDKWALLQDSTLDPAISISILQNVHHRWVTIMEAMSAEDWTRSFIHPEHNKKQSLDQVVTMYAWHGEHHLTHILNLKVRMGWR